MKTPQTITSFGVLGLCLAISLSSFNVAWATSGTTRQSPENIAQNNLQKKANPGVRSGDPFKGTCNMSGNCCCGGAPTTGSCFNQSECSSADAVFGGQCEVEAGGYYNECGTVRSAGH